MALARQNRPAIILTSAERNQEECQVDIAYLCGDSLENRIHNLADKTDSHSLAPSIQRSGPALTQKCFVLTFSRAEGLGCAFLALTGPGGPHVSGGVGEGEGAAANVSGWPTAGH